nr:MAG TPA: hypothetical protein [Bacteriophage sp.]
MHSLHLLSFSALNHLSGFLSKQSKGLYSLHE